MGRDTTDAGFMLLIYYYTCNVRADRWPAAIMAWLLSVLIFSYKYNTKTRSRTWQDLPFIVIIIISFYRETDFVYFRRWSKMYKKSGILESLLTLIPVRRHSQNDCCSIQGDWQKCTRFVFKYNIDSFFSLLMYAFVWCQSGYQK